MLKHSFALLLALAAGVGGAAGDVKSGKVLEWGWGTPPPAYVRDHIAEMEKVPFDGLVLDLRSNGGAKGTAGGFAWKAWSSTALKESDYSESVQALKETRFRRFTDNFLRFNVTPGPMDWFGEDFQGVLENARLLARVARECRLKGVLFDVEAYGFAPWHYPSQSRSKERSFADYQTQVRARGREFMQALRASYPDITVLLTYGYYIAYAQVLTGSPLEKTGYGLLPAFLDGMLEVAGPRNLVYDGWESSYGYRIEKPFREAREIMRSRGKEWSRVPDDYRKRYRASYGLWVDNGGKVWDRSDFTRNHFTPEEFEYSLHQALKHTDRYVWIYSHQARWWEGAVPQPYVAALANARRPHPNPPAMVQRQEEASGPQQLRSARAYKGADDQSTFGDLWERYTEVLSLPRAGWKFATDPKEGGVSGRWFAREFDDAAWKEIEIAEWWEPQSYRYDGEAWYRRWVEIPASAAGHKHLLVFGAVDESAWVYVNGRAAGKHDQGPVGWNERFEIDVTDLLKPGERNLIAVRVLDREMYGGIWKSVKLVTPK